MYLVQRIQMESLYNHIFFGTLTYNDECLPAINVNDHLIRYADLNHVVLSIKRLRKDKAFGRDFRYFLVSELGTLKGRPHFHCLFLLPKLPKDSYFDCLNLESKIYDTLKNIGLLTSVQTVNQSINLVLTMFKNSFMVNSNLTMTCTMLIPP